MKNVKKVCIHSVVRRLGAAASFTDSMSADAMHVGCVCARLLHKDALRS